jgi:hypothetical protein
METNIRVASFSSLFEACGGVALTSPASAGFPPPDPLCKTRQQPASTVTYGKKINACGELLSVTLWIGLQGEPTLFIVRSAAP